VRRSAISRLPPAAIFLQHTDPHIPHNYPRSGVCAATALRVRRVLRRTAGGVALLAGEVDYVKQSGAESVAAYPELGLALSVGAASNDAAPVRERLSAQIGARSGWRRSIWTGTIRCRSSLIGNLVNFIAR
jgi:hypothetical protein